MTNEERKQIKTWWVKLSAYYQTQLQDHVVDMYAEDVADLPVLEVMKAMNDYRRNPKNTKVPLPAAIRALVNPSVDDDSLARETASRIAAAISKFGNPNGQEARAYIGELGWIVVQRYGGWVRLCEEIGSTRSADTFFAHARDIVRAQITLAKAGRLDHPPAIPDANRLPIEPADSIVRRIMPVKSLPGGVGEEPKAGEPKQLQGPDSDGAPKIRCVHEVHGQDCFICHPTKGEP